MGNVNTQFQNLCVDNLIRTAELRPSKTAAHFRNTLGSLRGFDKFRIGIFVFPVHILCCAAPIRTGNTSAKNLGVAVTPRRKILLCKTKRLSVCYLLHIGVFRAAFERDNKSKSVIGCIVRNDLAGIFNTGFNHFRNFAVPSNNVNFHCLCLYPGTGPGRRVVSLTRYKGKDNFYISKHFSLNFAKKFCFVLNRRIPSYRSGRQRLFKRGVGRPVLAQFEPMFVFGPLDHNPANPVRVPGNIRVNLCFHSSLSVVQPKYRTRIGFVCTRRFPTLPADKSNGNSLSGRSVYSSNPTFCNGRIVLSSFLFG